jgi:hypothetical protein
MKAHRRKKEGTVATVSKAQRGKVVKNDQPFACYLCFLAPGLKYIVPIGFGPLPLRLKNETEFEIQG